MANSQIDSRYCTPQEHGLFGGTLNENYKRKPYTPLAVTDGKIKVEECEKERQKKRTFPIYGIRRSTGEILEMAIELAHLDTDRNSKTYGQTISEPVPVSERANGTVRILGKEALKTLEDLGIEIPYNRNEGQMQAGASE